MDPQPSPAESPRPWSILSTWLWSIAILVAALFAYGIALVGLCAVVIVRQPGVPIDGLTTHPLYDLVTTGTALTVVGLGAWLAVLLKDLSAREYLALRLPKLPQAALYAAITLLWIAGVLVIGPAFGHEPGLFLADQPAGPWLALLAAAGLRFVGVPLAIELFARGFMFQGLTAGRRSALPGLAATTVVATFLQCFFFASGPIYWFLALFESLVLGMARLRSGSLLLPIVLHVAMVVGLFGGALFAGPGGP